MKTTNKAMLAALAAAIGLSVSAPALAGGKHGHRHGHGHHRHWDAPRHHSHVHRQIVRERVVIERPVYVAPPVYPRYYPPRHPGVVVSVDIPPVFIPFP